MNQSRGISLSLLALLLLGGCATRPVNPPIKEAADEPGIHVPDPTEALQDSG